MGVAENAEVHQHLCSHSPDHTVRHLLAPLKGRSRHMTESWPRPDLFDQSCHFRLPFIGQSKFMSTLGFNRVKIYSRPPGKGARGCGIPGWGSEHFKQKYSPPHEE